MQVTEKNVPLQTESVMVALRQYRMPLTHFSALMSVLTLLFYNIPFFAFVSEHYDGSLWGRIMIVAGMTVVMLAMNFLACYLLVFLFRYAGRVILALSLFLNAVCTYFVVVYHTMMDGTMMSNVFNTRGVEASGFLSPWLFVWIAFLGILPAVYALWQRVDYGSWKRMGASAGIALGTIGVCVLLNFNIILWIGKYDAQLGGLLMPWSYTVNSCRVLAERHKSEQKEILLPDASFRDTQKTAVVLVIGESARKANFSLYGYDRQTNPRLSARDDIYALQARSCATYTTAGVKSMLEYAPKRKLYEILPNYLYRTGADVVWRTHNWGEPPVHIGEYVKFGTLKRQYPDLPEYDNLLFEGIKQRIVESDKDKVFIVLHTTTSHGPQYTKYYPDEFAVFQPVCSSVEEGKNNLPGLINAYDNSIVYTDYLLSNLIDSLATISDRHTAMLFVSDHGESLGENSLFMHGVPMAVAPKEQYEIPFLVWLSPGFRQIKRFDEEIDQHYVFHSILNLMSVSSPIYDKEKDIFNGND